MIKKLIKNILLDLLKEDYEVKLAVAKIGDPETTYQVEYGNLRNPPPKPPPWYRKSPTRDFKAF